jgi:hypothetical protein
VLLTIARPQRQSHPPEPIPPKKRTASRTQTLPENSRIQRNRPLAAQSAINARLSHYSAITLTPTKPRLRSSFYSYLITEQSLTEQQANIGTGRAIRETEAANIAADNTLPEK